MLAVDNTNVRRQSNKKNAIQFAAVGLAVFVSDGKVPLIPRYNKLDTDLTREDVEQAVADYMEKYDGQEPVHVGATKDINVIKRMFRRFPDAVPSIACGPSRLCVLDADSKDNGPELLGALFDEHGGVPAGVPVIPTQSGGQHLVFADPDGAFTNKAGLLKKNYGTDVRGTGGQFVGPGSIREDGKTYGTNTDKFNFLRAVNAKAIPTLPGFIADKIGQSDRSDETVTHIREREVVQALRDADHEAALAQFDPTLGQYDVEALKLANADFAALYDEPSADCSTNRFLAARHIMTEWPDMPAAALAAFFGEWAGAGTYTDDKPSAGEYDDRQIAREWLKNQGLSKPSTGEAFGAVRDEDEIGPADEGQGLAFEWESDVAANATLPDWLVNGVVETETLCFFYGTPNAGKSLALLSLLYHVAAGWSWHGRAVKQGCVLYISVEGPNGTARRAKAWRAFHNVAEADRLPMAFVRHPIDLFGNKRAAKAIIRAVARLEAITGLPCRAVAVDTVNAVTPGMDENSPQDWKAFLDNLRLISKRTKASVLAVHHTGKDESRGMRGSNSSLASADTTILVSDKVVTTVKMRDGVRGQRFPFEIKELKLWTDDEGQPVGAPVAVEKKAGAALGPVDESEDQDDVAKLTPPDTPADRQRAVLRVVTEHAEGIAAQTGDRPSQIGLSRSDVFRLLNIDRKRSGLAEYGEATVANRLLDKVIDAGGIVRDGTGRATVYRLAG